MFWSYTHTHTHARNVNELGGWIATTTPTIEEKRKHTGEYCTAYTLYISQFVSMKRSNRSTSSIFIVYQTYVRVCLFVRRTKQKKTKLYCHNKKQQRGEANNRTNKSVPISFTEKFIIAIHWTHSLTVFQLVILWHRH